MARSSYSCLTVFLFVILTLSLIATLCSPAQIERETLKGLATANNDLALKVLRRITTNSSENVFFSPMSLSIAFGMLYYGTKGQTAQELRETLGYETADLPEELVHQKFKQFITESLPCKDSSACVLSLANSILLDNNLDLVPTYKEEVQNLYHASVEDVDFAKEGPQIVEMMNDWVKEKTNGMIDSLLQRLDPGTILVLLNAIYFKGTWQTPFEPSSTQLQTFYNNGLQSEAKKVPLMRTTEYLPYTAVDDFQAVKLPYKGKNTSMLVLLPNERNGLESLVESLTLDKLAVILKNMHKADVHLVIPKFKIQYFREMSDDFKALGAKDIFQPGANFSGMTSDKDAFVNQILHKAVVEVNEEGSEAAAVTSILASRSRFFYFSPYFIADHPFLFAIVDDRSDMILFMGRVTNL